MKRELQRWSFWFTIYNSYTQRWTQDLIERMSLLMQIRLWYSFWTCCQIILTICLLFKIYKLFLLSNQGDWIENICLPFAVADAHMCIHGSPETVELPRMKNQFSKIHIPCTCKSPPRQVQGSGMGNIGWCNAGEYQYQTCLCVGLSYLDRSYCPCGSISAHRWQCQYFPFIKQ